MTQPRPYRGALPEEDAATELRAEAAAGRLDRIAIEAVLEAAGHRPSSARSGGPAGLTARESEVLGAARRRSAEQGDRPPARDQPEDGGNHVEHIYAKLGVTNRAGAALLAMQHGVIGPGDRPDG